MSVRANPQPAHPQRLFVVAAFVVAGLVAALVVFGIVVFVLMPREDATLPGTQRIVPDDALMLLVSVLASVGGWVAVFMGLVVVAGSAPDLVRAVRALAAPRVPIAQAEGRVAVQGVVEADGEPPLRAYGDGGPILFQRLVATESTGKRNLTRFDETASCRFAIFDGSGRIVVDALGARLLSAHTFAGYAPPAVLEHVGAVFARANGLKSYVEEVLRPGDFVTVLGVVQTSGSERRMLQPMTIVRGKPGLWSTPELRTPALALVGVIVGATLWWVFVQDM